MLGEGNIKMRIRDPRMTASGANDLYQASQPACNGRGLLIVIWKWIVKAEDVDQQGQSDGYSQRKQKLGMRSLWLPVITILSVLSSL